MCHGGQRRDCDNAGWVLWPGGGWAGGVIVGVCGCAVVSSRLPALLPHPPAYEALFPNRPLPTLVHTYPTLHPSRPPPPLPSTLLFDWPRLHLAAGRTGSQHAIRVVVEMYLFERAAL